MIKLDYITACVNTLDYLQCSYELNKNEFDRFTIVTSEKDKDTQKFCADNNLNCVVTELFYYQGRPFDRGLALNAAWQSLHQDADWICHLDCDVFVPKNWRERLPVLDKEYFYGAQRVLLDTYQDFSDFIHGVKKEEEFETPLGIGYGFFQMFNWNSEVVQSRIAQHQMVYPASPRGDVCESDWMFRNLWGEHLPNDYTKWKGKLDKLPFNVYHIGKHGQNHQGRVSPQFK